jgi:hypothetical protein
MVGHSLLSGRNTFLVAALIPGSMGLVGLDQSRVAAVSEPRSFPGTRMTNTMFQLLVQVDSSSGLQRRLDSSRFVGRLNGGSPDAPSKIKNLLSAIKNALWSGVVCFAGLLAVGFTMLMYFYSIAFFLSYVGADSISQGTIALFSLAGSVIGSLAGGACVGHLDASSPARHATFVGAAFAILQLRQITFMPIWYTVANVLAYVPCTVYSARITARRRLLRHSSEEAAKPTSDEVVANASLPNESGGVPTTAETPAPDSALVADGADQAPTAGLEGGDGVEAAAAKMSAT